MTANERTILIIGNFLSSSTKIPGAGEALSRKLSENGWVVYTASNKSNRLTRVVDMIHVAWKNRFEYRVAQIEVYSGLAFLWAEAVAYMMRILHKPYVLTLHGGALPRFAEKWPNRVRRLLAHADAITSPSAYLQQELSPFSQSIMVLPNALDTTRYRFRRREKVKPTIVWLRAFHKLYNPLLAVQAVDLLKQDCPDIHMTMIGPDKGDGSLAEVQQTISSLELSEHVTIVRGIRKSDVPKELNKADIFLNTSTIDNTPISVMEAMASGLCIVSTDVGGLPHLMKNEADALLVPSADKHALAFAIRRILDEPELAEQISSQACDRAAAFDWAQVIPEWNKLLTGILKEISGK